MTAVRRRARTGATPVSDEHAMLSTPLPPAVAAAALGAQDPPPGLTG